MHHCEMFNFDAPSKIDASNISQWQASFLLKDDFHTSQMKYLDMLPFICKVWISYLIIKDMYYYKIFNFYVPLKIDTSNIS